MNTSAGHLLYNSARISEGKRVAPSQFGALELQSPLGQLAEFGIGQRKRSAVYVCVSIHARATN